jgi:HlyD family secretion protein
MKEASQALWKHPLVLGAIGLTLVIAVGSGLYYVVSTRLPSTVLASPAMGSITEAVTGTGSVEPAQNPDLGFVNGGRVVRVNVAVNDKVSEGQVLALLDTATLLAQRANAEASLESQQAKLSEMQAGPRAVDTQPKQTAVDQANASLQNSYANVAANITQAYDQALNGVSLDTDTLFNQPNTPTPTLLFSTSNTQAGTDAANGRGQVNNTLTTWNLALEPLSSASSQAQLDAALITALNNLQVVQSYTSSVLAALSSAIPGSNFPQASISASETSVGALRTTVNGLVLTLQGLEQQIATQKLAVKSAQDALNQVLAGSTTQAVASQQAQVDAAQANVALYNAQINNSLIVAPFSGTVSSVRIKAGDIAAADTPAISLNPEGALQVTVYLSEVDAAKIAVGNKATVTLDAYGSSEPFAATVVTVDRSPTMQGGVPAYKATLQFGNPDPRITAGATANVTIITAQKDNVLVIPKNAVIQNGTYDFVLVQNGKTIEQRKVTLGILGTDTDEVTSGLTTSDQFLISSK